METFSDSGFSFSHVSLPQAETPTKGAFLQHMPFSLLWQALAGWAFPGETRSPKAVPRRAQRAHIGPSPWSRQGPFFPSEGGEVGAHHAPMILPKRCSTLASSAHLPNFSTTWRWPFEQSLVGSPELWNVGTCARDSLVTGLGASPAESHFNLLLRIPTVSQTC